MFVIGEIAVDGSVLGTRFACDLKACKGACCTFPGGRGAPLSDDEVGEIERAYPLVRELLPEEHRRTIEQHGLVDGGPGNYATQCMDGNACVFVYYEEGIAYCAFERVHRDGRNAWPKPLSCHLFPIRIRKDGKEIHYEYFSECEPALERGRTENIPLHQFVAGPLERAFGARWNRTLNERILDLNH